MNLTVNKGRAVRSFDFGSCGAYAQDERREEKFSMFLRLPHAARPERRCEAPKSKDRTEEESLRFRACQRAGGLR